MTTLRLADRGEAADLASFLGRLLRYDRAAAVRLQAAPTAGAGDAAGGVLAVFGRLPLGGSGAVAVRAVRLAGAVEPSDATVSAGQLLDALDTVAVRDAPDRSDAPDPPGGDSAELRVPPTVTGPAWAGLLPPRGGWRPLASLTGAPVTAAVAGAVAEFRDRSGAMAPESRTRAALDALADEIWSRPLDAAPELPLRAAHAAHVLGFVPPGAELSVLAVGGWLRLSAPHGSVALRRAAAPGSGLGLTPVG